MYPQTQLSNSASGSVEVRNYSNNTIGQPPMVQPSGIASRVQELQHQVSEIVSLAYQAKSALGITSPETNAKEPQGPSSLAEVLTDLRIKLARACGDIEDVIRHLNS